MSESQNNLKKIWQELKRRKVIKVILLYSTTAFILMQLIKLIIGVFYLPDWVQTLTFILFIIGLPVAIAFSWFYDVTPEGIGITVISHKNTNQQPIKTKKDIVTNVIIEILVVIVIILAYPQIFFVDNSSNENIMEEKSIAVLPFNDNSPAKENSYVLDGLRESILNNLSIIKNLKVISETSVEKYSEISKDSTPLDYKQIGKELNTTYIVKASGQKLGPQILLNIKLINATDETQIWSKQYINDYRYILNLQVEIIQSITNQIQAFITPEEENRIKKVPTNNVTAYDYYLKGNELLNFENNHPESGMENFISAKEYFEKAVELDNSFALAYAKLSRTYYFLDSGPDNGKYSIQINKYADKALLADPLLSECLIAKALYYINDDEYEFALPYLEKALQLNPNSDIALRLLFKIFFFKNKLVTDSIAELPKQ